MAPSPAEVPPGEELTDQPQPAAEEMPAAMRDEPEAVGGEGSTQEEVREEIAGAELEPPPREERPEQYRPARPQRPPPPPQRYEARQPRQPHPGQQAARQHGSAIHQAIQDVEQIVTDLREALEEMEEVLETLELAEREKTADEREIEQLRRALRNLHRPRESGPRPQQQYGQHQPREQREHREQRSFRGPERREPQGHRVESEGAHAESAHRDEPASSASSPPPEHPEDFEPPQPS